MSLPESVSFPGDRKALMNTLARFDNGVTVEDVVGKESDYDESRYTNTVLVQVLVEFMCHAFVKNEDLREKLARRVCDYLSPSKIVNNLLLAEKNNVVRVAVKNKVLKCMKQVYEEICPHIEYDASVLKYFESNDLSADFTLDYHNNFTELKKIGHGGFGTVFKVESKEDKSVYAIKKILFNYKNDAHYIKVMREVKNLSTLDHPNTISYNKAWLEIIPNGSCDNLNKPPSVNSSDDSSDDKTGVSDSYDEGSVHAMGIVIKDVSPNNSDSIIFMETGSVRNLKSLPSMDSEDYANSAEIDRTDSNNEKTESIDCTVARFSHSFNLNVKGILYIQMEYCDCDLGLWLKKRAEGEELPFEMDIFDMFIDILSGISYIHAKGIIHRDLKPHNIFYSSTTNTLKIGDFGLATLPQIPGDPFSGKVAKSLVHSSAVGTIPYAAPEQLKSKNYCAKVDMFSLGIILIELMNTCRTISELVKIIDDVKAGKITEEMKQFPHLGNLVKNLINPNPRERMSATDVLKMMMNEVKASTERDKKLEDKVKTLEETVERMERTYKSITDSINELNTRMNNLQQSS